MRPVLMFTSDGDRSWAPDIIESYTSLVWVDRLDEYGEFELVIDDFEVEHVWGKTFFIRVDDIIINIMSENSMIVTSIRHEDDPEKGRYIISGKSFSYVMKRRLTLVPPGSSDRNTYKYITELIKKQLDYNFSNPDNEELLQNRGIGTFTCLSTSPIEDTLDSSYEFTPRDNLGDIVYKICRQYGYGLSMQIFYPSTSVSVDNPIELKIIKPRYRENIFFDEAFGNITSESTYASSVDRVTVGIVKYDPIRDEFGNVTDGTLNTISDTELNSGISRVEKILSLDDVGFPKMEYEGTAKLADIFAYNNKLGARIRTYLHKTITDPVIELETSEGSLFTYSTDRERENSYSIGDIVRAVDPNGISVYYIVSEVVLSVEENGKVSILPTLRKYDRPVTL